VSRPGAPEHEGLGAAPEHIENRLRERERGLITKIDQALATALQASALAALLELTAAGELESLLRSPFPDLPCLV